MKKERVEYLDIEKALLILMMVLGHVFLDGPIRKFVYVFHMPAFLITSGIQYRYSSALEKNYFLFLKSRIFALLIPFLFFEVIGIIYHIVCFGKQQSLFGYIYNTLTQNWNNGASGFLVHLFGAENIIYVVLKRFHSVKLQTLVCIVLFCLAVSLLQGVNSFFGMILMYAAFGIVGYSFFYKVKPSLLLMVITLVVMIASSTFGIYIYRIVLDIPLMRSAILLEAYREHILSLALVCL